jgi:hypothetical protein
MSGYLINQKGNIALAMAMAIVGIMSTISLSMLAFLDTLGARYDFDEVQELLFLRSEAERGLSVVQRMDYSGEGMYLPVKTATVGGSHSQSTYRLMSRIQKDNVSTGGGLYITRGYKIMSLATVRRGESNLAYSCRRDSMVRKYGEKSVRRNSFAGYHYFTDTDQSTNGTQVYFWGPDVIQGKVHSNTDIWVKQGGGGSNNGWPTFLGPVYTAGQIRSASGPIPYLQVFRSGYWENVGDLEFNPEATQIQTSGMVVGPSSYDPARILLVTVSNNTYSSLIGYVMDAGPDTADVWTSYPPPGGQYQFRNIFIDYDTLWQPGPSGSLQNNSAYVKSKLWLRGTFAGKQTWCARDTLYLVGSCLLANTPQGLPPDGGVDGTGPVNLTDYLGIVSEKSILIKYGFVEPATGYRVKPNCGSDAQGIWIYAALCALGDGRGNSHKDGVFSFEYQHPHPSTPDRYVNGTLYTKIDLHLYKYPPTPAQPWPPEVDFPWYNPLWPESYGYMERGTIHLYGSVAQKRRGFVHRNVNDTEYPNPNGIWDIPVDLCGGPAYPSGNQYNAPGATGNGVGYKKDYHFDNRFSFTSPPDFPEVHLSGGFTPFESELWVLKRPPSHL